MGAAKNIPAGAKNTFKDLPNREALRAEMQAKQAQAQGQANQAKARVLNKVRTQKAKKGRG